MTDGRSRARVAVRVDRRAWDCITAERWYDLTRCVFRVKCADEGVADVEARDGTCTGAPLSRPRRDSLKKKKAKHHRDPPPGNIVAHGPAEFGGIVTSLSRVHTRRRSHATGDTALPKFPLD